MKINCKLIIEQDGDGLILYPVTTSDADLNQLVDRVRQNIITGEFLEMLEFAK